MHICRGKRTPNSVYADKTEKTGVFSMEKGGKWGWIMFLPLKKGAG
jgi:hypothetical protein